VEHPDVRPELAGLLSDLAAALGEPAGDIEDEHRRWELYRLTVRLPAVRPVLCRAVAAEPDPAVAAAAVVQLLFGADPDERLRLVALLPPSVQRFPRQRARELAVLDALRQADGPSGHTADEVASWSDWLQLQVAEFGADRPLRALLAAEGRTKRIRRLAAAAML